MYLGYLTNQSYIKIHKSICDDISNYFMSYRTQVRIELKICGIDIISEFII